MHAHAETASPSNSQGTTTGNMERSSSQRLKGHGPRTAGNKSLVSFRAGYGVTGYDGYIPSAESIPVPIKEGPAAQGGPEADRQRSQSDAWLAETAGEVGRTFSVYQQTIGRWQPGSPTRKAAMVSSSLPESLKGMMSGADAVSKNPPFIAQTLYRQSYGGMESKNPTPAQAQQGGEGTLLSLRSPKRPAFLMGTTVSDLCVCVCVL
jgi:hypothetical protein